MRHFPLLQPLSKLLVVVLCLLLVAPVGRAAEATGSSPGNAESPAAPEPAAVTSATASTSANSPELLTTDEVSELSARAEEPGPEVVGGALSNEHLTYIVIALAAAVIVLIAVT
jgi:hypothetical protein